MAEISSAAVHPAAEIQTDLALGRANNTDQLTLWHVLSATETLPHRNLLHRSGFPGFSSGSVGRLNPVLSVRTGLPCIRHGLHLGFGFNVNLKPGQFRSETGILPFLANGK